MNHNILFDVPHEPAMIHVYIPMVMAVLSLEGADCLHVATLLFAKSARIGMDRAEAIVQAIVAGQVEPARAEGEEYVAVGPLA